MDFHPCPNRWWCSCSSCCEKLPWNRRIIETQKALLLSLRNRAFSYYTLRKSLQTTSALSATSKQCFELTSSVLSTTSKQCFEQPAASFLVCSLIFIEYEFNGCQFSPDKGRVERGVVLPSLHTWFQVYRSCSRGRLKCHREV